MAGSLAASLAACGAGDGVSSQPTSTGANTAKSASKTPLQTPKFTEVKLSSAARASTNAPMLFRASQLGSASLGGYPIPPLIWNSHRINVCWENATDGNETQRNWVREAVTSAWDANSDVTFADWTQCPDYDTSPTYLGVRVAFADGGPRTLSPGEAGLGRRGDVRLRMAFNQWETQCATKDDSGNCLKQLFCWNWDDLEACVKIVAVHEFGHLLAFAHEQDRPETPEWCKNQPEVLQEPKRGDGVVFGPWDLHSVMNYCNPDWMGFGVLSPGDVSLVQAYYGKPGSKIYSVYTANDPPIVVIQDSKTFDYAADYLTIPNADGFVVRHFAATPDGNKVAYTLVNRQNHSTMLGYIDTHSDTLKLQKTIAEEIVDMQLSGDSKYAYVIWQQGSTTGLRAYDMSTLNVAWNLPIAGAKRIAAQRNVSSQRLYVVKNAGTGSAQSIAVVDINSHSQIASYPVGTTHSQALLVGLTPDEKTLYLADPSTENQLVPFIANLDTQSGQYNVLQPITPADAGVHDLHVLDSNRVLLGTNKQGIAPLVYDVGAKSFKAITDGIPDNWSLPFVYSPDGKTVFTMGQYWDDGIPYYSFVRLDSYRLQMATAPPIWAGSNHPVWSVGFGQDVVTRPFAVIYR
ncbi:hypothetical protein CUJ91_30360 [Paraburkholderia graminis]|uniref:hypothetical protein n=1 Tax=Paraburkholderia graminis TaxID=60548 RepID=UPI000DEEB27F|nr:hypothetical protein [Paraburkholderia graminis]AXF12099.1 hypothetical protein CUJ91_30360 [Paraburkholderia graminis]MDR6470825.1 hypothetical protein [Paraburkholderia graminis]